MSVPKAEESTPEGQVFRNAEVLTISEVNQLITNYTSTREKEGKSTQLNPIQAATKQYVSRFSVIENPDTIAKVRQILFQHALTKWEVGQIANLFPEGAEEAMTLIPSLQDSRFSEHDITNILNELEQFRSAY